MSKTISPPPSPLGAWQARSLHTVTCPSGQRVRIRILGLASMLEAGNLPDDLADIAILEVTHADGVAGAVAEQLVRDEVTDEAKKRALDMMRDFGRLQLHLCCRSIKEVEVSPDEWKPVELTLDQLVDGQLPEDDLAMVAEIVQRLRVRDAKGVRIGVEPIDQWASFREAHGCPDQDCEGCEKVVRTLSSIDVGGV